MSTRTRLPLAVLAALAAALNATAADVTWNGVDFTWDQPDANSFSAAYASGDNVTFGNTGVGAITVGAGVTPGTINFEHTSGTYSFSGTAWNAGSNDLNITGAGIVQLGNLANTAYTPTWGDTNISGGGALHLTRATNVGASNGLITLDNGTLMSSADNSATHTLTNVIHIGAGGGTVWGRSSGTNAVRINFNNTFTGEGTLNLVSSTSNTTNLWRGYGLMISGTQNAFTGNVVISSYLGGGSVLPTLPGQFGSAFTTFTSDASFFTNAASITVRDGGIAAVDYAASASVFDSLTIGPRGGIGATGANGSLANLTSPMNYVGVGGMLVLDNTISLNNDRISDTATVALNNNRLHIIGRSANTSATNEVVGTLSYTGSSTLTIDRPNATDSGVKLTATTLTTSSTAGDSLQLTWTNPGTTAALNGIIVSGTKPTVTNGMIAPNIQLYGGANTMGDFLTFSGDNLVVATYTGFAADWAAAAATDIVNLTAATTLTGTGAKDIHALRIQSGNQNLGGRTINIGSGGMMTTSATTSNGTLNFGSVAGVIGAYNGGSQATISATISGSNGLTLMGNSQTLNLTGNNSTLTGGIFVNVGRARFTTAAANGNDITVNTFGNLVAGSSSGATDTIGGLRGTGLVTSWQANIGANTSTIVISPASGTHTFNGGLTNGNGHLLAVTKSGAGTQIFGTDSVGTYTGVTSVTEGILRINGNFASASGAVTVSGGTLGGSGTIGGATTIQAGGTLAPGNSPGLLTFSNALTLEGAASFEINGTGRGTTYDAVNVGTALTYGGTLTASFGTTFGDGSYSFNLFDFDSQSGMFTSITLSGLYSGTLNSGNSYTLVSGDNTWSFNHGTGVLGLVVSGAVIPEPSTFAALAGLAALGLASSRRRRA